jgi:PAS domain S-box-containing protein
MPESSFSKMNGSPVAVVVNDDITQRKVLVHLLGKSGILVREFDRAAAALVAMAEAPVPDLIVTDLYMPEIDGWRFCRLLRSPEYPAYNHVPILVVSATLAGEEAARITADLGANAFLSAPVEGRRFIETAQALLAGRHPRNQLNVLLVEDSRTLAKQLEKFFLRHGFSVLVAPDLSSARELIDKNEPDLAVIDYHLPDGKGDALLPGPGSRRLDTVCIMMTTDPVPELALKWMQNGAGAYLRKPFDSGYLLEVCTRALKERAYVKMKDLLEDRTRDLRESRDLLKRKSEEQRLLLDHIATQVWYLSDADTYGRVNQAHADFLGNHPRELAYRKLDELFSPEVSAVCRKSNQSVFDRKQPVHTEEWVFDGRGESRLLHIIKTPKLDSNGRVEFVICTARDITEQQRALEQNQRQLGLITSLVNSIPDLVFYKDLKGVYLGCNHAFADHIGRTPEEIIGKTDYDLYTTAEADAFRANDMKMLELGKARHNEEFIDYPDGRRVLIDTLKAPLRSLDGKIFGSIGISRDITERKHLEARVRHLQKTESLGRMAGAVAHHYNNMLSIVQGYLELALADLFGEPDKTVNLSEAMKASQRAASLSHKMLAFLGKKEGPIPRAVDLYQICRDCISGLENSMDVPILLENRLPDPAPAIIADAGQVREILENLVTNAWESMVEKTPPTPVCVDLTLVRSMAIPPAYRYPVDFRPATGRYACIRVTDRGPGIPDVEVENIFDPFYSSKFVGRGLGLALTLSMVKAHEGCITVGKGPEQGTVFQIFFPTAPLSGSGE